MKFLRVTAPLTIFVISLVNIVLQYLGGGSVQRYMLNSDTLFWPTLLSDMIGRDGHLSDWSLPPSPYFFPDVALLIVSYIAGLGPYAQLLAIAVTQTAFVMIALWWLAKITATPHPLSGAAALVATFSYMALSANSPFDFTSSGPFVLMLVSVFHFGAFVASLFTVTLWLSIANSPTSEGSRKLRLALISVITLLSGISDSFFITQTIVPIVIIAFSQSRHERRVFGKPNWSLPSVMLITSAAGYFGESLLGYSTTRPVPRFGFEGSLQRLDSVVEQFLHVASAHPLFLFIFIVYIVIAAKSLRRVTERTASATRFDLMTSFSLLSMLSAACLPLVLINIPAIGARYLIPLFFWPVIVVTLHAYRNLRAWIVPASISLSALALIPLTANAVDLIATRGLGVSHYPKELACIDEVLERTEARNGLAQYWDARYLQTFSRLPVNIAQYSVDLKPMNVFTSRKYFWQAYDFAISSANVNAAWAIPRHVLEQVGGKPILVKRCGSRMVYVFAKGALHPERQ